MEFRRPKIYFHQFLLPIRILVGVPYFILFLLFLNVLKALTTMSGILLTYGVVWVLDRFVWPGLLDMPGGLFVVLVILTYVGLFYGLNRLSDSQPVIKPPRPAKHTSHDKFYDFLFEAKYIEPAIEIYGRDFKKPTFEEYGMVAEDYYSYNRRFSFEGFEFTLPLVCGFIAGIVASKNNLTQYSAHLGISVFIILCSALVIFEQLHSRNYPQHYKVKNYNRSKKIYESIQEDLRHEKFRLKRRS
jgi:hypothetical protein